jgi:hypothetical protein
MSYAFQDDIIGLPPVTRTDTIQHAPLGQIAHGVDPVLGGGEFIYLAGVAGTTIGSLVSYDQMNATTILGANPNSGTPLAVAMSANLAGSYGWYQITGNALVNKDGTALVAGGTVGLGTVAGTVGAETAGHQVLGAHAINAAAAGVTQANVQISRPHAQGAIT